MSTLLTIILASLGVSIISLVGLFLLLSNKVITKKHTQHFVSFAAGVMLGATFLDILPEALLDGDIELVMITALIGIVLAFFMERSVLWYHHHHSDTHNIKPSALIVLVGDAIHNFIDGFAIAATFLVYPALGLTTTLAIVAHEIPQELADFTILVSSGLSEKKALLYNFISALTALVGAFFGFYFLSQFQEFLPLALGFTGGMFIYIASADLIPELHRDYQKQKGYTQAITFVSGIALMFLITQF